MYVRLNIKKMYRKNADKTYIIPMFKGDKNCTCNVSNKCIYFIN